MRLPSKPMCNTALKILLDKTDKTVVTSYGSFSNFAGTMAEYLDHMRKQDRLVYMDESHSECATDKVHSAIVSQSSKGPTLK